MAQGCCPSPAPLIHVLQGVHEQVVQGVYGCCTTDPWQSPLVHCLPGHDHPAETAGRLVTRRINCRCGSALRRPQEIFFDYKSRLQYAFCRSETEPAGCRCCRAAVIGNTVNNGLGGCRKLNAKRRQWRLAALLNPSSAVSAPWLRSRPVAHIGSDTAAMMRHGCRLQNCRSHQTGRITR